MTSQVLGWNREFNWPKVADKRDCPFHVVENQPAPTALLARLYAL